MSWTDGLPPRQQRLDQWFAPRRNRKEVSTVVRRERVEEAFVVKRGLKRKVDVVSLGSEERYEVKKEVEEVVETKRRVEVISLGSEDAIEEVDGSLRVGSGQLKAQVTSGLKRKVEVLSSGSEDEDEEAVRVEEMLQMSSAPNQSEGIVSLGSEEDDIGEAKVAEAVYQQRKKPTVLSRSPKSVEEGEGYDGDEEYVEGVVDEDESEDQYLYKEGGDLEVTLQDTRDPAVIRWLEGVDSEVIEISSDSDSDADSVTPHSNNKMSSTIRSKSNSTSAASLLRTFQGGKSISLRNREPFISTSEQQEDPGKDFNILDFSSPSPPPSPGTRPCDTILKGFGYSQPVLDFTNELSPPATDHTTSTSDLVLGENQRDRSLSRSPGRVDHSPSPSTGSSDNASSHLDRFSGSESGHDEPRFQTPPSHQPKGRSPPPAPSKRHSQRDFRVTSDGYFEGPNVGTSHGNTPLNAILKLDKSLPQGFCSKEKAEETRDEEKQERPADKRALLIKPVSPLGLGNNVLQSRNTGKRPVETSTQEVQGGTTKEVVRPVPERPGPELGNSILRDSFGTRQERLCGTVTQSEAQYHDQDIDWEQAPSLQAVSDDDGMYQNSTFERAELDITSFAPIEDDTDHEVSEVGRERSFQENFGAPRNRPKVSSVTRTIAGSSNTSIRARLPCEKGCSDSFSRKDERNRHHRHVHKSGLFKCNIRGCNEEFLWRDGLKTHKATHGLSEARKPESILSAPSITTEGSKNFACSNCTSSYESKDNLQRHIAACHEKSQAGQSEPGERVSFQRVQEQPQQNAEDVVEGTQRVPAPGCSREGPTPTLTEGDVWTCVFPGCGAHRKKSADLEQHYRLKHDVRLYECNNAECDKKFTHKSRQKEHSLTCRNASGQVVGAVFSQPQTITPFELVKSAKVGIPPVLPQPPAVRKTTGFKCTICLQSSDPITRRLADLEVFYHMRDLNQHQQDVHFSASYNCPICYKGFANKRECLEHAREVHEPDFHPFGPPIPEMEEQDGRTMSPFDHLQPPAGIPDPRLMSSPEREEALDMLIMWTPELRDEERHDEGQLEHSISAGGQNGTAGKAAVVFTNSDLSQSSISSSLPSVGKFSSEWKIPARHGEAIDGNGGNGEMPDVPTWRVPRPIPGFGSNGRFGVEPGNATEPAHCKVSISGRKRKRMNDEAGRGAGSSLNGEEDYDSDEDLKFPSIQRKRLMNERAMKELKEEGELKIQVIE
ncbi:hypothetical protein EG328_005713 [Venturia inaequalis]|uniref:C2H2-type domain-containing protein n=1 Tax=Venturia inaequalis TaxID=5025 RepID=A0A8H3YVF6_VENIN|nr:hypothetical protein EG328_005713 [Venturia inaequalis]KAE9977853.1 hypothetical protein EG327_007581 [Venturia inaequalis]